MLVELFGWIADKYALREMRAYTSRLRQVPVDERITVFKTVNTTRLALEKTGHLPVRTFDELTIPNDMSWELCTLRLSKIARTMPKVERGLILPWLFSVRALLRPALRIETETMWEVFQDVMDDHYHEFTSNDPLGFIPYSIITRDYPCRKTTYPTD